MQNIYPLSINVNYITYCGHIFHTKCLQEWSLHNNSCPICRSKNVYLFDKYYILNSDLFLSGHFNQEIYDIYNFNNNNNIINNNNYNNYNDYNDYNNNDNNNNNTIINILYYYIFTIIIILILIF